jgi:membrane protein DedA with SNARE-associated domain
MNHIFGALVVGIPGALLAGLAAAASFWISGLPHHQASMLAAVIFPVVLLIYIFAVWRWRQKSPRAGKAEG